MMLGDVVQKGETENELEGENASTRLLLLLLSLRLSPLNKP